MKTTLPLAFAFLIGCSSEAPVVQDAADSGVQTDEDSGDPDTGPACGSCDNPCEGASTCDPGPDDPPALSTLTTNKVIGGFLVGGYEYWLWEPYESKKEWPYPDHAPMSYGEGSAPAKKCIAAANKRLVQILKDGPPQELIDLKAAHSDVNNFWQWNNDYTGCTKNQLAPKNLQSLWLWTYKDANGNVGVRRIKWISETNNDGMCRIPTREDLTAFAKKCMGQYPNCSLN